MWLQIIWLVGSMVGAERNASAQTRDITELRMPRTGQRIEMVGAWKVRKTMWDDAAILYRADRRDLRILRPGAGDSEVLWEYPAEGWSLVSGPTLSSDRQTAWLWLDSKSQLNALDLQSRRLSQLFYNAPGSAIGPSDGEKSYRPVYRRKGVVEDAQERALIFMIKSSGLSWRGDNETAMSLVSLSLDSGELSTLAANLPNVHSWDFSAEEKVLYTITRPKQRLRFTEQRLIEQRNMDGAVRKVFPRVQGLAESLALSPDERTLLVGRRYGVKAVLPDKSMDDLDASESEHLRQNRWGGFALLDIESCRVREGPERGCEVSWRPDGAQIGFADGWRLCLWDVPNASVATVILGEDSASDGAWHTWQDLAWSEDGRRLAVTAGTLPVMLMLDFVSKECMVIGSMGTEKLWLNASDLDADK